MSAQITPTGKELFFDKDEIIVTKTNIKGHIDYANELFVRLSGYTEKELIGKPHSIIRHPDMPRCIFKLLWDKIEAKEEIFAFVVNMAKNGDHYWVLAHVTPTMDEDGNIISYHSNRRVPDPAVIKGTIIPLYKRLVAEEQKYKNQKEGMHAAYALLEKTLQDKGVDYENFIFSLTTKRQLENA